MNSLPSHLLDEILFRLNLKSLVMMRCTNRSIRSHIFEDPNFEIRNFSRVGSSLLHISKYDSTLLCFHPFGSSRSFINREPLDLDFKILCSCSGLLLLLVNGLFCVTNPLTNKLRFLDHHLSDDPSYETTSTAFAVDQIDRTTQRFIIVCVNELVSLSYRRTYRFKTNAGDSWSKTRITCSASEFMKPVYLDGTFHWLKEDGRSIINGNGIRNSCSASLMTND